MKVSENELSLTFERKKTGKEVKLVQNLT